jgi:hypothetical protein
MLKIFYTLQVPGQQLVAPHLTSEAVAAQTSPQARRRRSTRLMKSGSFCSITSEGDGDIFGDAEAMAPAMHEPPHVVDSSSTNRGSTSTGSSGKYDPLSDYSEFHNDDASSDISDLFASRPSAFAASPYMEAASKPDIAQQGTLSETGSIEDITYEVPTSTVVTSRSLVTAVLADREDVSSCSLSIGSEDNNPPHTSMITVPVTIEHPPPEMRTQQPQRAEAACQQNTPASIAHHSQPSTNQVVSVEATPLLSNEEPEQPGMKMVLVRDIGIQVCGDSPNLNLARKCKPSSSHHHHHHHRHKAPASSAASAASVKQDSLAEKFPAEILF